MRKLAVFYLLILFVNSSQSQGLRKYAISNSGCSLYMYCDPKKFDFDYSEDSSKVYTGECINGEVNYGVICIKLLTPVDDLNKAEELMTSYLDFLKADFHVKDSAGYGRGHILNKNEKTKGIIDYWKDTEEQNWKIKAWTDGRYIGVLYAHSKKELPESKVNVFLDGFRLPEK
jgi:hypothetical protein